MAQDPEKASHHKANASRWRRLKDFVKNGSTFTDWCIAAFTLALAVTSIYQFIVIRGQLGAMQKDQRAWLQFQATPDMSDTEVMSLTVTSGQPITFPFRLTNSGKTPARNLTASIYVEVVDANKEPSLERVDRDTLPRGRIFSGILFPNATIVQPIPRPAQDGSPLKATEAEVADLKDSKAYLAVYGIITYDDVFDVHHWTRFCKPIGLKGTFHAKGCVQYNSVDRN